MNKFCLIFCTFLFFTTVARDGDIVVDELKAIIQDEDQVRIVTDSDVARRAFDGGTHSLDDLIIETAKDLHGVRLGVTIENDDVDRYLRTMAHDGSDMSKESLTTMSHEHGYDTLDEFYDDLKRLYRANAAMDQEIKSQLAVSEQEAKEYHQAHPQSKDAVYYLQTASVPFSSSLDNQELKKALQNSEQRSTVAKIDWQPVFDITESEVASDKNFIKTLNIGDVHVLETDRGFVLYKLKNSVPRHTVSFEECRKDIIKTLREEKFSGAYQQYNSSVLNDVQVTRCA